MKVFSSLHDPKSKRYAIYYSMVLVGVTVAVVITTFQLVHENLLQGIMMFFEGFFSLYMLTRNEKVGKAFLSHMSRITSIRRWLSLSRL